MKYLKNIGKKLQKVNIMKSLKLHRFTMPMIILMAVVVFLLSNFLLAQVSARIDLSQGKAYTLTDSSKKIINELNKQAVITFYVSSDIPAGLQPLKREVTDLLQEYDRAAGNVTLKIVDPKSDSAALKKAQEAGIQELPFQQMQQNKYEVTSAYFGLLIEYDSGKEVIQQVTDVESLEYNITSAIYKLTRKELPKVAIVGFQESFLPQADEIAGLKQVLSNQFTVETIPLPQPTPPVEEGMPEISQEPQPDFAIDPSYKTVMVFVTPQSNIGAKEVAVMKNYVKNNGKLLVFVNGVTVQDDIQTGATSPELLKMLSEFGIIVNKDLVLSTESELVNLGGQEFQLMLPYPFWLRTNRLNTETSYFSNTGLLSYPWSSSMELRDREGITTRELVYTTHESWAQTGTFTMDPQQIAEPTQDQFKQFLISAEAKMQKGGSLMVIGSARFVVDRYISQRSGNLGFVLNVLNDYASGGALSGIRQRAVTLYPLPDLPKQLESAFQYTNILFLPGIFILYGMVRLWRRNKGITK